MNRKVFNNCRWMHLARGIPLAGVLALAACASGGPRQTPEGIAKSSEATARTADNAPSIGAPATNPKSRESIDSTAAKHSEMGKQSPGHSIYFPENDATLSEESKEVIRQHAEKLKQNPKSLIVLRAFLEGLGSRTYSLAIVQKRLDHVVQYFRAQGIAQSRIRQIMLGRRSKKSACELPSCQSSEQRIELLYK